ncbi:MAG: rhodanese-like domain-containing protein [Phycisphaerales bacterium]
MSATSDAFDASGLPRGSTLDPGWEVGPRDVGRRLAAGADLVLIDVRTAQELALARIDGARHVPLQNLASHLSALRELEERPIVVFCHHGRRSLQATAFLREQGFGDVKSMAGGIDLWSQAVDPRVARY